MRAMKRYAIYFAPPEGALARTAAAWLGWDAEAGCPVPQPEFPDLPRPLAELTAEPRRYGFHATLKAPFRLAEGCSPEALAAAVEMLAADLAAVALDGLALGQMAGRFLALRPEGDDGPLKALAARIVTVLDPFRAPLSAQDLVRRNADKLGPRHRALLEQFGYPYVLEEFRFHMTLSSGLPPDLLGQLEAVARRTFDPLLPRPFRIDQICLFGEGEDGRFHLLHRYALTG
ncbi:DUF1045 domain-containing protein [Sinirhodobacter sp. WL0062]|uniref:DUF1045 domain-containing protein n=1 Tax=Rhodobacter flavimaris TaxID=2907145 RepID=A0ABS8Z2V1_9RHOB|nr:DUF1045 domain-containing protein [Sinirhodobacter sp. WL0062]MCE5974996.1 DUF1045 domain-containing protein [Sinirhodobacter sp. WL0062]